MNSLVKPLIGLVGVLLLALSAAPARASSLGVFVSIAPQKFFVRKIGGPLVNVSVLVPPGADAHTYEPRPRQMVALSKSTLYFAVGVDFEKSWLDRIAAANPAMRIIHTDAGIVKVPMTDPHRHGREPHGSGAPDPHIWLAPAPVRIQAAHILKALSEADPKNRLRYAAGYEAFLKELDALDDGLKALFAGRRGMRFMVFHPAWGYFAQAYGLKQVPVEVEGKEPKPAQLRALIQRAREQGIRVVFVQPQFSAKSAAMVAREIDGQVVTVDPMAEDWDANMLAVARQFRAALK
ncbi:MAG: zinc ABC transporter substrate-binding protein [Thermodesulfobacteriota bacterium]